MNASTETSLIADQPDHVFYVESSLRPGLTIDEYRRSRPRSPSRRERLRRLVVGAPTFAGRPA